MYGNTSKSNMSICDVILLAQDPLQSTHNTAPSSKGGREYSSLSMTYAACAGLDYINLPSVQLPQCNGRYENCLQFSDQFQTTIHEIRS